MQVSGHAIDTSPLVPWRVTPADPGPVIHADAGLAGEFPDNWQPLQNVAAERWDDDNCRCSHASLDQVQASATDIHHPARGGEPPLVTVLGYLLIGSADEADPHREGSAARC
jgi:hypothetical protein